MELNAALKELEALGTEQARKLISDTASRGMSSASATRT
jgi:hypothetical protein